MGETVRLVGDVDAEVRELIGDPNRVDEELRAFRKTAKRLSARSPRMIDRYRGQWIALYAGRIRAHGDSMESVLATVDEKRLPREHTIVRFIEDEPRTFIL